MAEKFGEKKADGKEKMDALNCRARETEEDMRGSMRRRRHRGRRRLTRLKVEKMRRVIFRTRLCVR